MLQMRTKEVEDLNDRLENSHEKNNENFNDNIKVKVHNSYFK